MFMACVSRCAIQARACAFRQSRYSAPVLWSGFVQRFDVNNFPGHAVRDLRLNRPVGLPFMIIPSVVQPQCRCDSFARPDRLNDIQSDDFVSLHRRRRNSTAMIPHLVPVVMGWRLPNLPVIFEAARFNTAPVALTATPLTVTLRVGSGRVQVDRARIPARLSIIEDPVNHGALTVPAVRTDRTPSSPRCDRLGISFPLHPRYWSFPGVLSTHVTRDVFFVVPGGESAHRSHEVHLCVFPWSSAFRTELQRTTVTGREVLRRL